VKVGSLLMLINDKNGDQFFLILVVAAVLFALLGVHSLHTTRGSTAIRRFEREVDVFLRVQANDETGHVYQLLTDSDMPLSDEDAGVVNGFGQAEFEDLRLKAAFQEIFDGETQDVIELHLGLVQHSDPHQTTQKGIAFEKSPGVFFFEGEEDSGGLSDFGEGEFDAPHFALVAKAELTDQFQFLIEALLFEGTTGRRVGLGCFRGKATHFFQSFFLNHGIIKYTFKQIETTQL